MSEPPVDPTSAWAWFARAESNLKRARLGHGTPGVFLEDMVFDAQQAVEKALKALLITRSIHFPKTHDISELLTLVECAGVSVPSMLTQAGGLSAYAVRTRYPGGPAVTEEDYQAAVKMADEVVTWARAHLPGD